MNDWDTDTLRTFRKYARAHAHAVTLQNRGHDIWLWIETDYGQDTTKLPSLL